MTDRTKEPLPASLEDIQALHADLLALSESRLLNIERLGNQLDATLKDFRALLDKNPRNDKSRETLGKGPYTWERRVKGSLLINDPGELDFDQKYTVNQEFQQTALQVADDLNLDELDAARICLESQADSETSGRSLHICAILRFHQRRKYLLDCLRLILQLANDLRDDGLQDGFKGVAAKIANGSNLPSESKYVRRCLTGMGDIKGWLQRLVDKLNTASVIGGGQQEELKEGTEYQRVSLVEQHESLGVIVLHLVKLGYFSTADFEVVLETVRTADKYDHLLRKLTFSDELGPRTLAYSWGIRCQIAR
jgi:nuclear pore complex protein Nup205